MWSSGAVWSFGFVEIVTSKTDHISLRSDPILGFRVGGFRVGFMDVDACGWSQRRTTSTYDYHQLGFSSKRL